jgi:hypothetical protein
MTAQTHRSLHNTRNASTSLLRMLGVVTILALLAQMASLLGIEIWLEHSLFDAATRVASSTAIGADAWGTPAGSSSLAAIHQSEHAIAAANHYRMLSAAIAWTTAAAAAVWFWKRDEASAPHALQLHPALVRAALAQGIR